MFVSFPKKCSVIFLFLLLIASSSVIAQPYYLPLEDQTITGTVNSTAWDSITVKNYVIEPSGDVTLGAGQKVRLQEGFHTKTGSEFYAYTKRPNPFYFQHILDAFPNNTYTSNTITLSGFNGSLTAKITGGNNATIIKNGQNINSLETQVLAGDELQLRSLSEPIDGTTLIVLNVAGYITPWLIATALENDLTEVQGEDSGYTAGSFNVDESGTANYSIPITVSPGTGGIEPKMSLTYSSQGGNGLLGMGWSIGGLSTITRCNATLAQDGFNDAVDFDENDRFCLDGERLIPFGLFDGGIELHTEQETFSRIVAYGGLETPTKFKVWTKAGLIMEYGFTEDSRIEAEGRTDIMIWTLNRIEDTKNNYLTITYDEDTSNGIYRIDRVDYTGNTKTGLTPYNSVQFFYEERPDSSLSYFKGSITRNTKRLSNIKAYHQNTIVRQYNLNYNPDGANTSDYSTLASIEECGTDGSCFNATTFEWEEEKTTLEDEGEWITGAYGNYQADSPRLRPGDFNGDGLMDMLIGPGGSGDWYVMTSNGSGFEDAGMWINGAYAGYAYLYNHVRVMDMNADGKSDILIGPSQSGEWFVLKSTGTGFVDDGAWITSNYGNWHTSTHIVRNVDMHGDGFTDILLGPNLEGKWFVLKNTGSNLVDEGLWATGTQASWHDKPDLVRFTDLNNDGLSDILLGPNTSGDWYAISNTGENLVDEGLWISTNYGGFFYNPFGIRQADMNGDGTQDLLLGPNASGNWYVLKNTGEEYLDEGLWATGQFGNWSGFQNRIRLVEINGDGLTDVLVGPDGDGSWHLLHNTGNNLNAEIKWIDSSPYGNWAVSNNPARIRTMDVSGDGLAEVVIGPDGDGKWFVMKSGDVDKKPYLLKSINNGHGATTSINYAALTDTTVYAKKDTATYPRMEFIAPMFVVKSYEVDNGIGGTNQANYFYEGGFLNLEGRGFRGFKKTTMTDEATGIKNVVFYERDHRCISTKIRRTEQYAPNGTLLQETDNEIAVLDVGRGLHYSYITETIQKSYELDGSLVKSVTSEYEYDNFGNVTMTNVIYDDGHTDLTENTYYNDRKNWFLGRLTQATSTKQTPGKSALSRTSNFEYDRYSGLLIKEVIEPNNRPQKLTKIYEHDSYGNITKSSYTGLNGEKTETRVQTTTYNEQGRFAVKSTNALGHTETKIYDPLLGVMTSQTGPNGITTRWKYDGFRRKLIEHRADDTQTIYAYKLCTSNTCPTGAKYYVYSETSGAAPSKVYYDFLDREMQKEAVGFDGTKIFIDTEYNYKGQTTQGSEPYFEGDTPLWNTFEYDTIGRPLSETAPGNLTTSTIYAGLTTTVTNTLGQTNIRIKNNIGQLIESIDNADQSTYYDYDSYGNLLSITDVTGNTTTMEYDIRGNKIQMSEPNSGTTTYTYNAFGELLSQTDAKGQTVRMKYDALGRLIERIEPEGTTKRVFDTQAYGIGKLATIEGPNDFNETYFYDELGRTIKEQLTQKSTNETYDIQYIYDAFGRIANLIYPTGFAVKHQYNAQGYLTEVRRVSDNHLFWEAKERNARGQLEEFQLGNNLTTNHTYNNNTGWLESILTSNTGGEDIQDMSFTFNDIGNLTYRADNKNGVNENFGYDLLNRLSGITTNGSVSTSNSVVTYDVIGNILTKSNLCYVYGEGNAGPNAVSSIKDFSGTLLYTYTYDSNGNRIISTGPSNSGTVTYTSFDKPTAITKGTKSIHFEYGTNHNRQIQKVYENGELKNTKLYIGGIYEKDINDLGVVKHTHFIQAGGSTIAVYTQEAGQNELRYLHKDHLGSIQTITDDQGDIIEVFNYDAWGKRRNGTTWGPYIDFTTVSFSFHRGFTGHEHLDDVALIHMNGRIYDPIIGRFLSPDPFVQAPENSQNLNRYTYVLNNPLSLTDPSGFFFKKIGRFFKKHWRTIAAVAVGVLTAGAAIWAAGALLGQQLTLGIALQAMAGAGGYSLTTLGAIVSGAGFGFGSAFSGTLLSGGSIGDAFKAGIKVGAINAVTAAAMNSINSFLPDWMDTANQANGKVKNAKNLITTKRVAVQLARNVARATVKGASSRLQGGNFASSFRFSLISDTIRWARDAFVEYEFSKYAISDENSSASDKISRSRSKWNQASKGATYKKEGHPIYDPDYSNPGSAVFSSKTEINWTHEKSDFMLGVGKVPGMNSMSVFHDHWAELTKVSSSNFFGKMSNYLTNQGTIPIAMGIEYAGLVGTTNMTFSHLK